MTSGASQRAEPALVRVAEADCSVTSSTTLAIPKSEMRASLFSETRMFDCGIKNEKVGEVEMKKWKERARTHFTGEGGICQFAMDRGKK